MNDLEQRALEVIRKIEYLNLSTVTPDGEPWGSPVYTAFDNKLNFFWLSWKQNQHSVNVRSNAKVFATIYDSTVPCSTGFGVYMKGTARQVNNPITIAKILVVFYGRRGKQPRDVKTLLSKYPRRLYMLTPEQMWVNGEGDIKGNFIDVRTEISIESLHKGLSS